MKCVPLKRVIRAEQEVEMYLCLASVQDDPAKRDRYKLAAAKQELYAKALRGQYNYYQSTLLNAKT